MKQTYDWKEVTGVLGVLLILVGVPVWLWYWDAIAMPHRYPPGTKIITLTASASDGIWTLEQIEGYNYWWHRPARVKQIDLNQGDHVVVRVRSADVLHSFSVPIMHIGPVDVQAGHTVEVSFDANRPGILTFLCWQVCSPDHDKLRGRFLVKPKATGEDR